MLPERQPTPRRHGPQKGADRRGFGQLRKRSSGRWQAGYSGPDQRTHYAPATFLRKGDAQAWLAAEHKLLESGDWTPPKARATARHTRGITVAEYADQWLESHRRSNGAELKPRTKAHYRKLVDDQITPTLGDVEMRHLTPERVEAWFTGLDPSTPTLRAHAYGVLRTMLQSATRGSTPLLRFNPCQMPGAGNSKRVHRIEPATVDELAKLVAAMPEKYRLMTLLASWCGLRYGELAELRRKDLLLSKQEVKISRGVVKTGGKFVVGPPKSEAGIRHVAIPAALIPAIEEHLKEHAEPGREGLLFPAKQGGHLSQSTLFKSFEKARLAAGRPDLRFHDLRHTGAVLAAQTGATIAELMARLGHSTPQAAMRYQHAARGRDHEIAALLSKMAERDSSI